MRRCRAAGLPQRVQRLQAGAEKRLAKRVLDDVGAIQRGAQSRLAHAQLRGHAGHVTHETLTPIAEHHAGIEELVAVFIEPRGGAHDDGQRLAPGQACELYAVNRSLR